MQSMYITLVHVRPPLEHFLGRTLNSNVNIYVHIYTKQCLNSQDITLIGKGLHPYSQLL